jgi:hypothetical protein
MIGLSSEDSRIIEDALWRIVSNSYSGPRNKVTTRIAKHFSLHSSS